MLEHMSTTRRHSQPFCIFSLFLTDKKETYFGVLGDYLQSSAHTSLLVRNYLANNNTIIMPQSLAHFHYVLYIGAVFAIIAGFIQW
jgi:Heme/copper-type cytochrome/quinol oxidases, subunit 1